MYKNFKSASNALKRKHTCDPYLIKIESAFVDDINSDHYFKIISINFICIQFKTIKSKVQLINHKISHYSSTFYGLAISEAAREAGMLAFERT